MPEAIVTEIEGLHNPSEGLYLFDYDGEWKMPPMILVLDEYDLSPEALADHDMDHVGAVFWDVESESWGMIAEGADGTDTEEISGFATSEEAIQATQTFLAEHAEAPPAETGDGVTEVGPDEFEEEAGTIETGSASYSLGPKGPEL